MTDREYRHYKDEYLEDLRDDLEVWLNHWFDINKSKYDKKLNEAVLDMMTNGYKRLKTLTYFPEFDWKEES